VNLGVNNKRVEADSGWGLILLYQFIVIMRSCQTQKLIYLNLVPISGKKMEE
jgi:hypothetical protein